jgi:hypothetical protein
LAAFHDLGILLRLCALLIIWEEIFPDPIEPAVKSGWLLLSFLLLLLALLVEFEVN